jgi:3-dehydroquinate synthase
MAGERRPLLAGLDEASRARRLAEILHAREPFYDEVADMVAGTDGDDPGAVADELARRIGPARRVCVDLGPRSYDVLVEPGGLLRLGRAMRRAGLAAGRAALVVDRAVSETEWFARALGGIAEAGFTVSPVFVPSGEEAKTLAQLERVLEAFAAASLDRRSPVIALGGGATTDLAGFAAAVYMRGVPAVLAPTTLLGMVDAAIGGKTGVNLAHGKNLAGAFSQPRLVMCDPDALRTLPEREWQSGAGEVAKYALIGSPARFDLARIEVAARPEDARALCDLIAACAAEKAAVVAADEREERGGRKVLNFGHTIGHAIEAAAGYGAIAHGEAVLLGMRAAIFLSLRRGLLPEAEAARLLDFLGRFFAPAFPAGLADDLILEKLARDKKSMGGKSLFVLLRAQGAPEIDVEVSREDVLAALAFLRRGGLL